MAKKLTTEEFINRARAVHGDKYGYDEVVYVNSKVKVSITCPTHGKFYQSPSMHVYKKQGCNKCSRLEANKKLTHSTEFFISKAEKRHNRKYLYYDVEYIGAHDKVCIICPVHGKFEQSPNEHLKGKGCSKCGTYNTSTGQTFTTEEFIERSKAVHGDKFSYVNAKYVNSTTKIEVICKKHGSFFPTPNNHISKMTGCPKCATVISKGHAEVGAFLESILNG
jgi:hypothetical protein